MTNAHHTETSKAAAMRRAFFRLHFYAGLIVAPFVLILALTGAIYLFNTEIEDVAHPHWRFVQQEGPALAPDVLVNGALAAFPGARPTRIDLPDTPHRTAVVFLKPEVGKPFRVYVDPMSGQALGSFIYDATLIGWADNMHGSLLLGGNGDLIVELAACWAIVMILTGLYLWWPRTAEGMLAAFAPRLKNGRIMLRDLHAVGGMWVSLLLLFLLITGLPWSDNWGGNLNRVMAAAGIGHPPSYRTQIDSSVVSSHHGETLAATNPGIPWALEAAAAPRSEASHHAHTISVGAAARIFADHGLTTAYRLVYPRNGRDVYTAYTYPDQPEGQRTIHLDQYTGAVINDVRFADYGAGAKAVEWGVQLHMGNYFGLPNQIQMLIAALGAAALSITGPLLWLRRRKTGLGAPKNLAAPGATFGVAALLISLGVIFPALGVTALAVFLVERVVLRRIRPVRDWLGLAA